MGFGNEEGVKRANSRKAKELVELIHVVRELDPKRARELLAKYPRSRMRHKESKGDETQSGGNDDEHDFAMPLIPFHETPNMTEMQAEMQKYTKMAEKADAAKAALENDPAKALSLIAEVAPRFRASLLASAAARVSAKNAELGQTLLDKCATLLSEIKDPGDRVMPWAKIAEAAHIEERWSRWRPCSMRWTILPPSTRGYGCGCTQRCPAGVLAIHRGLPHGDVERKQVLGASAEPLLAGIPVSDLALLARVEGRAPSSNSPERNGDQWEHFEVGRRAFLGGLPAPPARRCRRRTNGPTSSSCLPTISVTETCCYGHPTIRTQSRPHGWRACDSAGHSAAPVCTPSRVTTDGRSVRSGLSRVWARAQGGLQDSEITLAHALRLDGRRAARGSPRP